MSVNVSERIVILKTKICAQLDDSVFYVNNSCSEDESKIYRRAVGIAMGSIEQVIATMEVRHSFQTTLNENDYKLDIYPPVSGDYPPEALRGVICEAR